MPHVEAQKVQVARPAGSRPAKRAAVVLLAAALAACGGTEEASLRARAEAVESIDGGAIRRHMEALAGDDMEGREAGTRGFEKAADYVAEQYRSMGLDPIGDDGGYFQEIGFFETRLAPGTARASFSKREAEIELVFGEDFLRRGGYGDEDEEVTAPLVFVGYGLRALEYGHDDFAGVDPAGKILVVLSGAPPRFETDQRAFYSSSRGKDATASALGAVGVLTVRTPVDRARSPWARFLPGIGTPGLRWLEAGEPHLGFPELIGNALLSESGAEKLFALSGHDLEALFERHAAGETGSFDMGVSATLARRSLQGRTTSANVVGLLPGGDPALRREVVLFTAHLDHVGVRAAEDGDEISNGAYDNAAGVGVMLEVAAAMAAMEPKPRRSVLFAAVTAEEKGLQGSSYLAHHPPVPAARIVANVNLDMPFLGFPVADVQALGAEHTTLLGAVERAAAASGLELTPDPLPEQVRFIRSDQYSFVERGIPAVFLTAGSKSSDPAIDGAAMLAGFLADHYHRPSDDLSLPYDAEGAERFARTALLLGLLVAADDERPRWNPGDFFGERFARRPDQGAGVGRDRS